MRALYLVLLVLLCLPLQAGEAPELERAIGMFRSPDVALRAQGTEVANRELRRLLAPFLAALKDPDPEVRRRVREALLALVPFHERATETPQQQLNRLRQAQLQALQGWRRVNVRPQLPRPRINIQPAQQKALDALRRAALLNNKANAQKGQAVLTKMGVTGNFVQIGRRKGFQVTAVKKDSAAAKAGLLVGDMLIGVNKVDLAGYETFLKAMDPRMGWRGTKLQLLRRGQPSEITLR